MPQLEMLPNLGNWLKFEILNAEWVTQECTR